MEKTLMLRKKDFRHSRDWDALLKALDLNSETVGIEMRCRVAVAKCNYTKCNDFEEYIEVIREKSVLEIEEFLGYPLSDIVLEDLDERIKEVLMQMPEEELDKIIPQSNKYNKSLDEPLIFIECLQLIENLIDIGIIQRVPEGSNRIAIYRAKGIEEPEGWYSENIFTVAQELLGDIEGQQYLRGILAEKGIKKPFKKSND